MSYHVKEVFRTLQGEGANTGRSAVFCRFSGCNLWSGREQDRPTARCRFCDTDFVGTDGVGGGVFDSADALAWKIQHEWDADGPAFVVCTGGEPLLQVDSALLKVLHDRGCFIAVETNGTIRAPKGLDWICVSPKAGVELQQQSGNELKLVFPQEGLDPRQVDHLDFEHFFLQPMDGPNRLKNTELAVRYCMEHPRWRLSVQTHKWLGIP